jgi:hypothetical protein
VLHKISPGCYKDTTIADIVDKNKMCNNGLMNRIFAVLSMALSLSLSLMLFAVSCTARINGSLQGDGQADLQIYAALEPRMTALLGGLAAASGAMQPGAPILNGPSIAASMSTAPGVASASFKNTTPTAIEGPVKIARIGDFLAPGLAASAAIGAAQGKKGPGFITFEQSASSKTGGSSAAGRCTINLSLDSGPEILALISPDFGDYLSALMAPLATGEVLTKTEYLTLVASVYGRGIADEIAKAFFRASIDFPGPVRSVTGGTFSGKKAEFAIPLLDILVLEKPLSYEVVL